MRKYALALTAGTGVPAVQQTIRSAILSAARNPDPHSLFAAKTADIRHLGDEPLLAALEHRGYDALVAIEDDQFVGFSAFQKHGNGSEWHGFFHFVPESLQGRGVGKDLVREFIAHARQAGASIVIVWNGDERHELPAKHREAMEHIFSEASHNRIGLPFMVHRGTRTGELLLQ